MTTLWQVQVPAMPVPPVLTVLVRAFLAGRAAQAETEKELSALIPSMPALSLSKGWIGRLRESCKKGVTMEGLNRSKSHGELTVKMALKLSGYWEEGGYKVLYDHGPSNESVGTIVSIVKKEYHREDELSQLDIAIVKQGSNQVAALIEIEETTDNPKTFIGDVFGVLFGEYICFKRKELHVGDFTTLIVVGFNKTNHKDRNEYILDQVNRVKTSLGTQNAKIGKVVIKTYADERELIAQLPSALDRAF
jgi:hypothetical protein